MDNQNYVKERNKTARIIWRVSLYTLAVNIVLTILKSIFGFVFFNISVLSDAVHSLSDVGTTLLVILATVISKPKEDKEHNYGHEKHEPIITLFFSLVLGATGFLLVYQGIYGLVYIQRIVASPYLIAVTVASIVMKEAMFWYTIYFAKKTHSTALKADAWHHRSDSLSSVAVLVGLVCSLFIKTNLVESIAIIIVALLIIKVAFDVLRVSLNQLTDKAVDKETYAKIMTAAGQINGVQNVDKLKTRLFGSAIYVDIEIGVDENLSIKDAHKIGDDVHDCLEALPNLRIKHCNVHVGPTSVNNV
ncbi:MAG: cation diffusion facilitator family transporter [Christensenellaceae bacterium]|jgi:cation diffusion facilitator family transporter|nr:cation diffusion facilitator family transporter [Christensenellaceae bacterium]